MARQEAISAVKLRGDHHVMAAKDMESMRWQETAMPRMVQGLVIDVGLGTRSDVDQIHGVTAWLSPVMIRKTSLKETAANTGHERPQEAFGQPIVLKCVVRCRRMPCSLSQR